MIKFSSLSVVQGHAPDSAYSWLRLGGALVVGTVACVALWSVVAAIPEIQAEFKTSRAEASFGFTAMMLGFGFGTVAMGKIADRYGIIPPLFGSAILLFIGYVIAGMAPNLWIYWFAHTFFIGIGGAAGFSPMMSDISHWFVRRRGLAVVLAACGSYIAGALWPMVMNQTIPLYGWRATHIGIGIAALVILLPMTMLFRQKPLKSTMVAAEAAQEAARGSLGVQPNTLQALLTFAGIACCVAMAMPQVHIVAYCGDLGYGVSSGREMLSLMLGLGVVSRIASGFMADKIGGAATLLIGSFMQAVALALYLFFNGLSSLYWISAIFGLFQGGIVPMYAVLVREFLPPREAGFRVSIVISATVLGMAIGGYISGLIFDLTASYRWAFLHGLAWNSVNLGLAGWLWYRRQKALAKS